MKWVFNSNLLLLCDLMTMWARWSFQVALGYWLLFPHAYLHSPFIPAWVKLPAIVWWCSSTTESSSTGELCPQWLLTPGTWQNRPRDHALPFPSVKSSQQWLHCLSCNSVCVYHSALRIQGLSFKRLDKKKKNPGNRAVEDDSSSCSKTKALWRLSWKSGLL